ncbi:cytochrome P450 [Mycolicibacterium sp. 050232]|uniref:cytochrome P450 n=1 Tax=Mycolicibacterium sp. 050232 TaxID=3113982 RepID=UPI002E2826B7|nr:cytochrome P450 [Mycolicibacterium sp. 050232]MED5810865.1 cytochrome P450 [Mycolicibacterium sp. 050232]
MNIIEKIRSSETMLTPFMSAARLNAVAAVRTRTRGYRGWTGAVNTEYDPLDRATAAQPFGAYRDLHRSGRVHYNPRRSTWILSRHEDVRAALRDTDAVTSTEGVTRMKISGPVLVLTDGAEHARLRKQVQPGFSKGAMAGWQEMTDKLAAELVSDVLANPGCDVVQRLTIPMPMRMIAHILGIPDADVTQFRTWSEAGMHIVDFEPTRHGVVRSVKAVASLAQLQRYFMRQFASGGLKSSDTVLGRLLAHADDGSLTDSQLFYIAMLLLIAGNETTTNLLGGMFDTLARNPDQYELIRANPDLVPMAVEEHLRISTPIQNLYRYTRMDYQVGDVTIPRGSRILLSFAAANRDPLVFADPDEFRADRNPRNHIAFGYGAHMCVGAPLARMEAQAVLRELITRVATIAPAGEPTWSTNTSLRGPTHLPIRLTPS